jgi:la-related protein 4
LEATREAVRKQIEYYFSKENLATDRFLLSQMDPEMFVPIATIANFKMITALTNDLDLIVNVMKASPSVIVNEATMTVKPNLKANRNTIILRDIPTGTSPQVSITRSCLGYYYFIALRQSSIAILEALLFSQALCTI